MSSCYSSIPRSVSSVLSISGVARGGPWPPQTFGKCFFLEWIDVVTWFEYVSRPGKCAWISVSVHKRRATRRWPKNVPEPRERDWFVNGKNFSYYPPPPTECDPVLEITDNFCYYPPPHWMGSAPGEMMKNVPGSPPPNKNPGYAVAFNCVRQVGCLRRVEMAGCQRCLECGWRLRPEILLPGHLAMRK